MENLLINTVPDYYPFQTYEEWSKFQEAERQQFIREYELSIKDYENKSLEELLKLI